MRIEGIVWLQRIIDKLITKHHIKPEEVEQIFTNSPQYRLLEKRKIDNKNVYSAYGRTNAGRYVTVIFIKKYSNRALVISSRDMDKKERKQYGK